MKLYDRMTLDAKPRLTPDGYLVATAKVARTGIQDYLPQELGKTGSKPLRLYRPAEEVFSDETLSSFAHRPITNNHPADMVDSTNWTRLAKGYSGDMVAKDGDFIRVPLTLMDADTVKAQQNGKRELSAGYTADIDWTAGVTDDGQEYDGVMRNIRANHIALVDTARAGHQSRIGDNIQEICMETVKMVVDGLTIETTEQGKQALEKVQKALTDAQAEHKDVLEAKDKELATKDAEIAELKDKVMSDADLDKAIAQRSDLIGIASKIADVDYKGKSLAEIRKTAIAAKLGDAAIADKSDAYIEARFDVLAESIKDSGATNTKPNSTPSNVQDAAAKAQDDYAQRVYNPNFKEA